jgi:FlaA1/EpsC-like NDP-sugar epimerase
MTIPEAASLVIQAGSMARGGEVFLLDMGQPVRIDDLARRMIALSGHTVRDHQQPEGDIEIQYSGLRPGEKLYEELLIGNNPAGTEHPMIMQATEHAPEWEVVKRQLDQMSDALATFDSARGRALLVEAVAEYTPSHRLHDLVWETRHPPVVALPERRGSESASREARAQPRLDG